MDYQASEEEIKRGKQLHSILLFDFIVVHIFVFIVALSMVKISYFPLMLVPGLSIPMLAYVMLKARNAIRQEPSWFVRCHMLLASKRAKMFLILHIVTAAFTALLLIGGASIGMKQVLSMALALGVGQLPFMVALLVLVVIEFDAEHQCKIGKVPPSAAKLHTATEAGQAVNG